LDIASNSSASLPFDKIRNYVAFHIDKITEDKQNQIFKADSLINNAPSGISVGNHYTLMRSQLYRAYVTIFLEPLIIIKNCLPFSLCLDVVGKRGSSYKTRQYEFKTQDEVELTEFNPGDSVRIKCNTETFTTNEYKILPSDSRIGQRLFFYHQNKKVHLDILTPVSKSDATFRLLISAKLCVINESTENLSFIACGESNSAWVSPFSLWSKEGNEIVVFDSISAIKIRPKSEESMISDLIPLNRLGTFPIDVYDGQKQMLNLGIHITNVLCGKLVFKQIIIILRSPE